MSSSGPKLAGTCLLTVIQAVGVALIVAVGLYGGELVNTFGVGVANVTP